MKRFTTLVFAALIALTLSMPAWAQSTTGTNNNQANTAAKKEAKKEKKEAAKAKKAAAKSKKKADKDTKKTSTK